MNIIYFSYKKWTYQETSYKISLGSKGFQILQ